MSVLNRIPKIVEILENCSSLELATLKALINGEGEAPVHRSLRPLAGLMLTEADKGVKNMILDVSDIRAQGTYTGYLVYNDYNCVLIAYSGNRNQNLSMILIDPTDLSYVINGANLTIDELRNNIAEVELKGLVSAVSSAGLKRLIVPSLPTEDIETNIIYMVLDTEAEEPGNVYNEYMYINNAWELIGTTSAAGMGLEILELSSASGTLSEDDFETASQDNCVIKYDLSLFYKGEDNSTYMTYNIYSLANTGIYGNRIVITKSSRAYSITEKNYVANPNFDGTETLLTGLEYGSNNYKVNYETLAPAFSTSLTYAVGDLVTKDGKLYACNTTISVAEDWTAAHWTETNIASAVLGLINVGL